MVRAVYAGTFDPLTNGHLDVIKRAAKLVDELIVLVANNALKVHKFTTEERIQMIKNALKDAPKIKVDSTNGLIVNYAQEHDIKIMFRGLRNIQDYEYEYSLSEYNANINPNVETVLLFPSRNNHFVSSSAIKELVYHNVDISLYIPKENIELVKKKLSL
ncbi:pantetheine-phosphate adenylyltransferase [Haploplasma axanthum]|uniref:Phosphopantetheine adenylyltransferase n=1 Tax=Haploplasma axanthum TaxID=29552 RepID=A0A449BDE3_HAPAX|nr:pantetheine-phosphate adenylyltransferase [Haploplasma axanthum]VEU80481.1 pantetheine-phosphate adenylyltransferase [Haploplasma axanthum]